MFHVSKITLILEPNLNNFILVQTLGKPVSLKVLIPINWLINPRIFM